MKYVVTIDDQEVELDVERSGGRASVEVHGKVQPADLVRIGDSPIYSLILGSRSYEVAVHRKNGVYTVVLEGQSYDARVMDELDLMMAGSSGAGARAQKGEVIKAPMPGVVVGVSVEEGGEVSPGQGVVTLEAMKMENELRAETAGVVKEVRAEVGRGVSQGEILVVIE